MLGKLLERAQAGKRLEAGATVSQLLDLYMPLAEWDVSTREGFEGYVRRTIRPGLGHLKVRKEVHGPILDTFYARLKKCGDLTCNGKPFTERHNVPAARPARRPQVPGSVRSRRTPGAAWQIQTGARPAGGPLGGARDVRRAALTMALTGAALAHWYFQEYLPASRPTFVYSGSGLSISSSPFFAWLDGLGGLLICCLWLGTARMCARGRDGARLPAG